MLLVALALAGAVSVSEAVAGTSEDPPPDPGVGQIAQYVEVIPNAQGGVPSATLEKRRGAGDGAALSPRVRRAVKTTGGTDADVLIQVASSARIVAPSKRPQSTSGQGQRAKAPVASRSEPLKLLPSVREAVVTDSGRWRLLAVSVIVALLTWALVVAARARARAGFMRADHGRRSRRMA